MHYISELFLLSAVVDFPELATTIMAPIPHALMQCVFATLPDKR